MHADSANALVAGSFRFHDCSLSEVSAGLYHIIGCMAATGRSRATGRSHATGLCGLGGAPSAGHHVSSLRLLLEIAGKAARGTAGCKAEAVLPAAGGGRVVYSTFAGLRL